MGVCLKFWHKGYSWTKWIKSFYSYDLFTQNEVVYICEKWWIMPFCITRFPSEINRIFYLSPPNKILLLFARFDGFRKRKREKKYWAISERLIVIVVLTHPLLKFVSNHLNNIPIVKYCSRFWKRNQRNSCIIKGITNCKSKDSYKSL